MPFKCIVDDLPTEGGGVGGGVLRGVRSNGSPREGSGVLIRGSNGEQISLSDGTDGNGVVRGVPIMCDPPIDGSKTDTRKLIPELSHIVSIYRHLCTLFIGTTRPMQNIER